jgi:hypothetical protein
MRTSSLLAIGATALCLTAGTALAQTTYFTNGVLRNQTWTNPDQSRVNIETNLAGRPNTDSLDLTILDVPTSNPNIDNWGQRISGLFIPAATGKYVFFCASDDDGDLFLSTDASPSNKKLIAQEASWSNVDQWTTAGGGTSLASQKRSDQWTNSAGIAPFKDGFALTAGQKYWIEFVKHDGSGGDSACVTFKLANDIDPANGTASALTGNLIGYGFDIPGVMIVTAQVTNTSAIDSREAGFTYGVANPIPDPSLTDTLVYNWYRNGTLMVSNGGPRLTFLASTADDGAKYQCIATVAPRYESSLSSTSAVGTLTVSSGSVSFTNGLKVEQFNGVTRVDVESGNTLHADSIRVSGSDGSATLNFTGAETFVNDTVNYYGRRMSGWFLPPADGNYVFFVCSDDDSDLFLSTDNNPANKKLIAQENNWSNSRQWTNGSSILSQKRSDQWTNELGEVPFYAGIPLKAGTPYYIEAANHQGTGGDNLGILAQIAGTADPADGSLPIPSSQLVLKTTPVTALAWTNEPVNLKVFENAQPIFTGGVTTDSEFKPLYQWQRDGTNIPGATTTSYTLNATLVDNGTKFSLIAATAEGELMITSKVVTLTVQQAVFEKGLALMNYWVNQTDQTLGERGLFGPPDFVMAVPSFEAGVNNENGDNYVNQISGFFVPATSGVYDFICAGDDHIDVFISTDSNPNNKRLICQQPGWSDVLYWTESSGHGGLGADDGQKNSATWTNASGVAPFSGGLQLNVGTRYYIEAWHEEGGSGDSMAVTVVKHNDPAPAPGTDSAITGNLLGFNAPNTATFVQFTNQPLSMTLTSGTPANFTAGGISDGPILIGTTGQFQTGTAAGDKKFLPFPNVLFQWYKNGSLIPGATISTYTTPLLKPADNNAQFTAQIRTLGIANWTTSSVAVVTVITDTNKPTVYASAFDENGLQVISVSFSKFMDLATITNLANYSLSGGGNTRIWDVVINTNDLRHVQLKLTEPPVGSMTLNLAGITDFSGNSLAVTTLNVALSALANTDVGDITVPDPAWPGSMWVDGPGAYTVQSQGSDIWGKVDGFNFSYESKTNDFDVVVRQVSFTKVSNWSKGGLMLREDLTPQSRNWNIVNDPTSADGINAIDSSGTGANTVESNCRSTNGFDSVSWATGPATIPAYPNAWVRLKRTGQLLQSFWSSNAVQWVQQAAADISTNASGPLTPSLYVGICCTAHDNNLVTATTLNYYYTASFAGYNSAYVAPTNIVSPTLSAAVSGGNIVISWSPTGGTLQSSSDLGSGAAWTPVGVPNPATVPISGAARFFRVIP